MALRQLPLCLTCSALQVLESWRLILKNGNTRIRVSDVYAVAGDGLGIVTCVEEVDSGRPLQHAASSC